MKAQLCTALLILATWSASAVSQEEGTRDEPRDRLLARAQVWRSAEIASLDLYRGPTGPGAFAPGETVTCDYVPREFSGASPKFACRLSDGDVLKVKYGGTNGEVYGEVIATRLLWALGFGADRMYSVQVVCRGCPEEIGGILRVNGDRIVAPSAVERELPGREIAGGWSWRELDRVDETRGGAPRAHRDALILLAVLLQHSDSKPDNQRLVCVDEHDDGQCPTPLLLLHDVGITFGRANRFNQQPRGSVHLEEWSAVSIWHNRDDCIGSLSGSLTGTLKNPTISEAGRAFLAGLLTQLSDRQLHDMFRAGRVELRPRVPDRGRSGFPTVGEWVDVFKQKRAEIVEHQCAA